MQTANVPTETFEVDKSKAKQKLIASRDFKLSNNATVHVMIAPKLGLVIITDLQDFGENWLKIVVERGSFDIAQLNGEKSHLQALARYLVGMIEKSFKNEELRLKFVLNINLREETCNDRSIVRELGTNLACLCKEMCI